MYILEEQNEELKSGERRNGKRQREGGKKNEKRRKRKTGIKGGGNGGEKRLKAQETEQTLERSEERNGCVRVSEKRKNRANEWDG